MTVVRRLSALAAAAVLLSALSGCNYKREFQKSNYDYASRANNDPKMMHVRSHGSWTGNPKQHDNKYFEYSSALSAKVANLPGVNTALVFLTDKNAYVAILTDWSATGAKARGGVREQDNTGTTEGVYNVSNGSSKWDNRQVSTPYNSYFSHKDYSDISSELRQVIGNTVRDMHQRVEEVHISANREFVNQSLEYAKVAWQNKPLNEFTPRFNTLVRYVFANGSEIPLPLSSQEQSQPNR